MGDASGPERRRLERADWIAAAAELFAAEGVDRVLVVPLAERLGVTRGSFYWHFRDRRDLLDALVALWRRKNTRALVEAATRPAADFPERFLAIMRCWIDPALYDPRLDIAMRDWARRDADILAQVRADDDERVAAFARAFAERGEDADMAFIRARVVYYMQLGYYLVGIAEPLVQRLRYLPHYYQAFVGETLPAETAREWVKRLSVPG